MRVVRRAHLLPFLFITLTALLLNACAANRLDMMEDLNRTLRGYEKAVRWAQFDAVYSFHRWQEGQEPTIPTSMEKIKVTQYKTSREKFDPKAKVMKQTVTIRYYNTDDQRVRSLKHPHEWKYFEESERWYLISEPIAFP